MLTCVLPPLQHGLHRTALLLRCAQWSRAAGEDKCAERVLAEARGSCSAHESDGGDNTDWAVRAAGGVARCWAAVELARSGRHDEARDESALGVAQLEAALGLAVCVVGMLLLLQCHVMSFCSFYTVCFSLRCDASAYTA